jgi:CHAD domain-containing protein
MAVANATTRFARRQANRLLTDLGRKLARAAESAGPSAVHDLRVAIRRLQQVLAVFKTSFPPRPRKKVRRVLKHIMDPAGEVRNCDIAAVLIPKLAPRIAPRLRRKIQSDRKTAERKLAPSLRRLLDRDLPTKWRVSLELSRAAARNGPARREIPPTAQRIVKKMAARFLALGKKAASQETSVREVHRFRIASKKFRYTLELVEPFQGARAAPWLDRVKAVQSVLGDVNDCETVRRMASRWNAGGGLIAKLEGRQKRKLRKFRREWAAMPAIGAFPAIAPVKPAASSASRSASSRSATLRSAVA